MPDTGTLDRSTIAAVPLRLSAGPLVFSDARWLQVTFEVPRRAALERLPSDVTRPIPCYARFFAAEGTLGEERAAFGALSVGGRFAMMPRNVLAWGATLQHQVAATFTNGVELGSVAIERDGAAVRASVSVEDRHVATAMLPGMYAIEPSMLRWDPWLAIAGQDGNSVLTELLVTAEIESAYLAKGATVEPEPSLPGTHSFRQLRNLLTISACYAEGTLTFSAPRVLQECS